MGARIPGGLAGQIAAPVVEAQMRMSADRAEFFGVRMAAHGWSWSRMIVPGPAPESASRGHGARRSALTPGASRGATSAANLTSSSL